MTKFFALGLLLSVLFLPNIALSSSFAARPEDIIILLACMYLLFRKILFNTFYSWVLITMFVLFLTSMGLNARLLSVNSFEFYNKIVKGLVSYTVFLLFMQEEENYQTLIKVLVIALIINLLGNFLQLLNISVIATLLAKYSTAGQIGAIEKAMMFGRVPRLTGFIGNPNNNAVFFVCMAGLTLDLFFIRRERIYLLLIIGVMAVIVLTQSRTMFVALLLVFLVVAFTTGKMSLVFIGGVFLLIIKYFVDIPYLNLLFDTNKLSQTHSVTGRIHEWANLFAMIKQQPILGFGGYKEYFYITQTYPENEYILAWFRYGIIYLIVFCGMMIISVVQGIISAQRKIFGGYFMLATNLTLLISSMSNTPFNNPRLFVFYSLVQAIYAASLLYAVNNQDDIKNV